MSSKSEQAVSRQIIPSRCDAERWRKKAEEMTFYGIELTSLTLSRSDLLAIIGHLQERIERIQEAAMCAGSYTIPVHVAEISPSPHGKTT